MIGRLERAYARFSIECAESLREKFPELEADAEWIAGGVALFAGEGSPLSMAYGLGFEGEVTQENIDELEEFYESRDCGAVVDVCDAAHPSLMAILDERDYSPLEPRDVMVRQVEDLDDLEDADFEGLQLITDPGPLWAQVVTEGFYPSADVPLYLRAIFHTYLDIPSSTCVLALVDGEPAGGGALGVYDEVGMLFGTSVLPEFRGRGVQKALLQARLEIAAAAGCEIAMVFTDPHSPSQRNVLRQGFQITHRKIRMVQPT